MMTATGLLNLNLPVNMYWGNAHYAVCVARNVLSKNCLIHWKEFLEEYSDYFHIDQFPPYNRLWVEGDTVLMDYGSHEHYLYIIPTN